MWKILFVCLVMWPSALLGSNWNISDYAGTNIVNKTNAAEVAAALGFLTNGSTGVSLSGTFSGDVSAPLNVTNLTVGSLQLAGSTNAVILQGFGTLGANSLYYQISSTILTNPVTAFSIVYSGGVWDIYDNLARLAYHSATLVNATWTVDTFGAGPGGSSALVTSITGTAFWGGTHVFTNLTAQSATLVNPILYGQPTLPTFHIGTYVSVNAILLGIDSSGNMVQSGTAQWIGNFLGDFWGAFPASTNVATLNGNGSYFTGVQATHLLSGDTQTNTTIFGATVTGNLNPTNAVLTNSISGNSATASSVNPTNFNSQFTALGGVTNRRSVDLVVTNAGVSTTIKSNSVTTGTFIGSAVGLTNVGTSGRAQLVDGTNRISTTAIQLNSIVLLTYFSIDGTSASPFYRTNEIAAGSAFTVRSGVTGDTNSINWFIVP